MSSKINILGIITGHFNTLREADGKRSVPDFITFIILPITLSIISIIFSFNLNNELSSLLVNFGSIFTALLLSVLVLVYDQESKLEDKKETVGLYDEKKELLSQLYYNISYSILCSLALVVLCFLHAVLLNVETVFTISQFTITIKYDIYLLTPLVVLVISNLFLNILMIVKRMHAGVPPF
jgi:hypothetical protein